MKHKQLTIVKYKQLSKQDFQFQSQIQQIYAIRNIIAQLFSQCNTVKGGNDITIPQCTNYFY